MNGYSKNDYKNKATNRCLYYRKLDEKQIIWKTVLKNKRYNQKNRFSR